jgi:hypothetical protein
MIRIFWLRRRWDASELLRKKSRVSERLDAAALFSTRIIHDAWASTWRKLVSLGRLSS